MILVDETEKFHQKIDLRETFRPQKNCLFQHYKKNERSFFEEGIVTLSHETLSSKLLSKQRPMLNLKDTLKIAISERLLRPIQTTNEIFNYTCRSGPYLAAAPYP